MNSIKVGKFIAECRKEKNLTQSELASILGVSNKTVSRWETGVNFPDISLFDLLTKTLDISVSELLKGEKIKEIKKEDMGDIAANILKIQKENNSFYIKIIIILILLFIEAIIGLFLFFNNRDEDDSLTIFKNLRYSIIDNDDTIYSLFLETDPYNHISYEFACTKITNNIIKDESPTKRMELSSCYDDWTILSDLQNYFYNKKFDKTISLSDLDGLDSKITNNISKELILDLFNKAINNKSLDKKHKYYDYYDHILQKENYLMYVNNEFDEYSEEEHYKWKVYYNIHNGFIVDIRIIYEDDLGIKRFNNIEKEIIEKQKFEYKNYNEDYPFWSLSNLLNDIHNYTYILG